MERSNFCQLIEMRDQYLADKGFKIHDLITLRGGSLYILDQFTESQCLKTMSIANVRIHVKTAIKRIKAWHIFNQVLPLSTHGSINQIINPIISVKSRSGGRSHKKVPAFKSKMAANML